MQGHDDMVRLAACLERVPLGRKIELGEWLLERLAKPRENPQTWWAVGRLATREPVFGSAHQVVPPETAAAWIGQLLARNWAEVEPAPFAAALIARRTGDRERDLPPELRREVAERLRTIKSSPAWARMVLEVVELEIVDQKRLLGDSLPQGLRLVQ